MAKKHESDAAAAEPPTFSGNLIRAIGRQSRGQMKYEFRRLPGDAPEVLTRSQLIGRLYSGDPTEFYACLASADELWAEGRTNVWVSYPYGARLSADELA